MYDEGKDDEIDMTGSLLLAHPSLRDPNFARSVVLMTAHEDQGSLGVVINKRAGQRLGEINQEFETYGLGDVPLYIGGPVSQEQIILTAWKVEPELNEFKLYFGLEPLLAQSKLETEPGLEMRAFKGYAGWGQGQLVGEIRENAWVLSRMDGYALNAHHGDKLWRHAIMNIDIELGLLSLAPDKVEWN